MTPRENPAASGRLLAVLGLLLIAATWGVIFAPIKIALREVSALEFLHLRLWFALAFLLPLVAWRAYHRLDGRALTQRRVWAPGVLAGGTLTAIYWLQTEGLRGTTSSKAGFITGLTVMIVPLFYSLIKRSRPDGSIVAATLVSFLGITLASVTDFTLSFTGADALILLATLFNASHIIMMGTIGQRIDPVAFNTVQSIVNAAIISAMLGSAVPDFGAVSALTLVIAAATGFYAIGILLLLQSWAQKQVSPVIAGLAFTTEPIFAALSGFVLLGEVITRLQLLGFTLVFLAMVAVEGRTLFRWPLSRSTQRNIAT